MITSLKKDTIILKAQACVFVKCFAGDFGMVWKVVTSPSISKSVTFESFPKH